MVDPILSAIKVEGDDSGSLCHDFVRKKEEEITSD
jgi:hypothetical protein